MHVVVQDRLGRLSMGLIVNVSKPRKAVFRTLYLDLECKSQKQLIEITYLTKKVERAFCSVFTKET